MCGKVKWQSVAQREIEIEREREKDRPISKMNHRHRLSDSTSYDETVPEFG